MNRTSPLVSVMMPARNAAATIGAALASVLDESDVRLEIVVVDNGSTDGTADVVKSFGDDRIVLVKGPGTTVNAARNTALEAMTGDWITLLDADDEWLPNRVAVLLKQAQEWGAPLIADDLLVVPEDLSASFSLLDSRGLRRRVPCRITAAEFARLDLGWVKPLAHTDLLGDLRFPAHIRKAGDFPFWFQAVKRANGLWLASQTGYRYRYRQAESVSVDSPALWLQVVAATAQLLSEPSLDLTGGERAALERRLWLAWGRYHRITAREAWAAGDSVAAVRRAATAPSIIGERARSAGVHLLWWARRQQSRPKAVGSHNGDHLRGAARVDSNAKDSP